MTELAATAPNPRRAQYLAPGGPWDRPSLDRALDEAASRASGVVLVDGTTRLDGAELRRRVATRAVALRKSGAGAGTTVMWQGANTADSVVLTRACWRVGATAVPLHARFSARDVDAATDRIEPTVMLAPTREAAPDTALNTALHTTDRVAEDSGSVSEPFDDPTIAVALHTSGSSGPAKVVLHDSRALAYKAARMVEVHGLGTDDRVLMPAPLAHVSGLLNGILVPGFVPMRTVLMDRWDPDHALDLIEAEQVTFMVGPPTFFISMMDASTFSTDRVASLRLVSSGGAEVTPAFCREASERLDAVVKRTYGSTEAPTVATSGAEDDPETQSSTEGRAIAPVELAIAEADGEDRGGGVGELLIRGPELSVGYVEQADTNTAFSAEGWFHSGDLATIDAAGRLRIVGRLSDVVIRGGENVSMTEVEAVVLAHPDVREACVVGFADRLMGERIALYVATSSDSSFGVDVCRTWCEAAGLARFKIPEQVTVLDALPVLASGKIDRAALHADASRRFVA